MSEKNDQTISKVPDRGWKTVLMELWINLRFWTDFSAFFHDFWLDKHPTVNTETGTYRHRPRKTKGTTKDLQYAKS